MMTLSKVRSEFMTVAKWAAVVIGVLLVIYFIGKTISFFTNSSKNKTANVLFGRLTKIDFPKGITNNFSYSVDTISGALPALPAQVKVYKMSQAEPDLLAVQRTSQKVAELGFKSAPQQISDVLYRWDSDAPFKRSLTVNINRSQFSLSSAFITDPNVLSANRLPDQAHAIDKAKEFIQSLAFLPDDLDETATKVKLLRIANGTITDASSFSNAQLLSVYFFEKKDEIPFVYPVGGLSTMNLTIASSGFDPIVVDARFSYQKVLEDNATYPLITAQEALEKLKKGEGYISSHDGSSNNIFIKNVYLAYYSEGKEQKYLMPVIVFEGNDNFFAYVSAVRDEWVSN